MLAGLDLTLEQGEFVAVVGYSGSGKTTLVSLIGGLLAPDAGSITLDGALVTEPGPERGIVFQQYSLLPWMSVFDNVAPRRGRREQGPAARRSARASPRSSSPS